MSTATEQTPQCTVLVVDDEPEVVASVRRQLRREFRVLTANDANEALELLGRESVQVIVSDQRMPEISGVELLAEVRERFPKTTRIMLTGYADLKAVIGSVNSGQIFRYITKPWNPDEIRSIVQDAGERSRLLTENERLIEELKRANQELEQRVEVRTRALAVSEQRCRSIVEGTRDPVMLVDANDMIVAINPAFTRVTGFAVEESLGQGPDLLASGRHPPEFFAAMQRQLEVEGTWRGLVWNRRKDGGLYVQRLSVTMARAPSGEPVSYVYVYTDLDEEGETLDQLWIDAHHDPLTGLPNRALLMDRLKTGLQEAERRGCRLALLFLDLDGFKPVNDTHGHAMGDELLRTISERMRGQLRETDTVARIGGDEFAVLLPGVSNPEEIAQLRQRLVRAVAAPYSTDETTIRVGVSIGCATYPEDGAEAEALLALADQAMYADKRARKGAAGPVSAP
jgi:diguanylate cyclase (GGDEF)-like protein/PAS domain S-box-containing protein